MYVVYKHVMVVTTVSANRKKANCSVPGAAVMLAALHIVLRVTD